MIWCYQSVHLDLKGEASKQPEISAVANIVAKKIELELGLGPLFRL